MAHPIPPPTEASLHDAALRHLARYATTVAGLVRVLDRRIDRWAREASPEPEAIRPLRDAARAVAKRLAGAGAVDDRVFAASRARTLTRAGRSSRAIAAHLAARGTDREATRAALPDDPERELAAAIVAARRRRFGPWRAEVADKDARRREIATLARAGFSERVARSVLALSRDEAEAVIAKRDA
jgi:regulatory protein